ncbi:lysophospholipid acyltransferase family protein [Palleronia sp. KMU-117]|uniref:lysophospholipid acyltransferase family protein n=1 Tax=Palleronia sp. KMU-117 TaxID=3434108 RepID=UPI003D730F92
MSTTGKRSLRKRIADSETLNNALAAVLARYVAFCHRTSIWDRRGFEELTEFLKTGQPAVMCLWHQRLLMAPYLFDQDTARICSLNTTARAGMLAGRILEKLGFEVEAMHPTATNVTVSRAVLGRMKRGYSVGMATDGTRGPARVSKTHPLLWARSAQAPIYVVAYAGKRCIHLPSWDRMMVPVPFTRGALVIRRFEEEVPRKMDEAELEALRQKLDQALDAVTEEADRIAGRIA